MKKLHFIPDTSNGKEVQLAAPRSLTPSYIPPEKAVAPLTGQLGTNNKLVRLAQLSFFLLRRKKRSPIGLHVLIPYHHLRPALCWWSLRLGR